MVPPPTLAKTAPPMDALDQNAFAEGARFCHTIMQAQFQQSMEMQQLRMQLAQAQQQLSNMLGTPPPPVPAVPAVRPGMAAGP